MASTSETGHAKNIANLKSLNEINAGFGTSYNPSNLLLENATMATQWSTCDGLQGEVNTQAGVFLPFVTGRIAEFKDAKAIVRRVRSAAKSCGGSATFVKNVNTKITKILGERLSKPKATTTDPAGTSASQQSYDNIANNFGALVGLLAGEVKYAPNEAELKVTNLLARHTAMDTKNNAVKTGKVPYTKAIQARNKALYTAETGLVDVGQASKDYVRSVFGYSSAEFRSVSGLKFRKMAEV